MASEQEIDDSKAPLLEHLIELRQRLIYSAVAFVFAFIGSYFIAEQIYGFLVAPLANEFAGQEGRRLIFTGLHEAFFTYLKVAFFASAFISFPVVAAQIYMFVAPGLYKNERNAFLPFLVATPILFTTGAALVYYVVIPLAWSFFISFELPSDGDQLAMVLEPKVNEYLSLVMRLIFAFGICFQLPVLLTLLAKVGLATSEGLAEKRKYAIVITFLVAAFLTPPDLISQIGLGVPMILLYEISIYAVKIVERRRKEAEDSEAEAAAD